MTDTILNFSTNQSASNLLLSQSDAQTLIDASVLAAIPTFSNATNYLAGDKVYYLGIFYVAPVNINLGGGTPLVNTTWRQIPTWGSYTTTATAAVTTTLDLYSSEIQRFSGVTTQTVVLPVVTTLPALGKPFYFINDSTGTVTVNSSGGNLVATILGGQRYLINCILLTGTTAASWTVSSGYETTTTIGALISGSTAKTTLVDADLIPLDDSAASNILKNITWQNLKASIFAYTTTATAAGTTTLTAASTIYQFFTGSTTQTVVLPVTSTLYTGLKYIVYNNSSGLVTVQSSGANTILILAGGTSAEFVCILTSGTTAASWQLKYDGTIVTSGKKLSATASLTLAGTDAKTLTVSNSITLAGTDGTVMTFPGSSATIPSDALVVHLAGSETITGAKIFSSNLSVGASFGTFQSQAIGVYGSSSAGLKLTNSTTGTADSDGFEVVVSGSDGYIQNREATGNISIYTAGVERMKITSAGVVELPIGQLKFPATANPSADANTLDDYEEGTFTPGFAFNAGTTGITYSTQKGTYVKIGSAVFYKLYCQLSNKGSSTGSATVTGLPFTSSSTGNTYSCFSFRADTISYTGLIQGYISTNATTIGLEKLVEAGTVSSLAETNFANTSAIMIEGHYII